jgi:hypothetical protein
MNDTRFADRPLPASGALRRTDRNQTKAAAFAVAT